MNEAESHIVKARENITFARYALTGGYTDEAGRSAYMAAFHAALAFIVACTGSHRKLIASREVNSRVSRAADYVSTASRFRFLGGHTN
jgi:hypothetical protein